MKVGLVVNPIAGRGLAPRRAEMAVREMDRVGASCVVALTTDESGAAGRLARQMAADGCAVVFAAGGDGTINEVISGLAGTEAALGVIPAGLANVWAKEAGLSVSRGSYESLLRDGLVFDTDLGRANGRLFLLMAGIGFDADVVAKVTPANKERWRQFAYVGRAVSAGAAWQSVQAEVEGGSGCVWEGAFFGAIAANASNYAGMLELAPEGKLDDGCFDLVIWQDGNLLSRVTSMLLADARLRRFDGRATSLRLREAKLTASRPLPVHTDAELAGSTPCQIDVLQRALPVLLPPSAGSRYVREGRPLTRRAGSPAHS